MKKTNLFVKAYGSNVNKFVELGLSSVEKSEIENFEKTFYYFSCSASCSVHRNRFQLYLCPGHCESSGTSVANRKSHAGWKLG